MSHLAQVYARDLSVKVGRPVIQEHFYPFLFDKYITIHNSDKVPAKSYSYWPDVIKILKPELDKRGIEIVQIGSGDDKKIDGVEHFINDTTFKQSFYILKNSLCQVGIDSCPIHIASAYDIPTVSIYAHTYSATCDPLWNKDKATIIESHRNGKKPSFSLNEDPKTIDIIKPEEIANGVFESLGFKDYKSQETLFIGKKYLSKIIDIIPDQIPKNIEEEDCLVRVRMDLANNNDILLNILSNRKGSVEVVTKETLDQSILESFKHKISKIIYSNSDFDEGFLKYLKHSGIDFELNCYDKKNLSKVRAKFFNYDIVFEDKKSEAKKLKEENKGKIKEGSQFYSGRFYVSGQNTMATLGKDMEDLKFWLDIPYFRVYV